MEDGKEANITNISGDNTDIGKKQCLKIDFDLIFASERDESPAELVVVPSTARDGDQCRRRKEKRRKPVADSSSASSSSFGDDLARMSEAELKSMIERKAETIAKLGDKLPDKGAKLNTQVQLLKEELERRKHRRFQEDASGSKKPTNSAIANSNGELDKPKGGAPSSQPSEHSKFATLLRKKLEDNEKTKSEQNAGDQSINAFDHEISHFSRCDRQKKKPFGQLPLSKRAKPSLSSKGFSAWKSNSCSRNSEKYMSLDRYLVGGASSTGSLPRKAKLAVSYTEKDAAQDLNTDGAKNEKTVVLVDEEELEHVERKQDAEQLPSSTTHGKIYYPSRKDSESLEIFLSELKCLEPGECLTSTIMNFYIRFLQESPTERLQHNFYFFNTYFYSKLQEAVAYQKSAKESFFIKFRRWWRGVNIFQKAYILLPINEDNHWSLVIICIPDKEDESGLIMLHLDSLGLHSSRSIFYNIKSLLTNEWKHLSEDVGAREIPISERIWKNLPCRIDKEVITVPRQTNEYDCGLFVLYYMERFIQEAPERLKRQHLTMFGRSWFKPQEASSLRGKIKKILQEEFHKALREDNCVWQAVSLSANAEAAKVIDRVEIS